MDIVGNTRTVDPVIRREMRIAEGDAYNRVLVDRSKTEVKRLGFFKTVDITQQPGDAPDKTVLQVKVAEQSTGELSLGAGYSTIDKLMLDFGISEHNFRGEGQDLRLRADIGYLSQQVDLSLTEPRLFGRDLRGSVDLFDYRTDYSQYTGFISSEIGASANVLFPAEHQRDLLAPLRHPPGQRQRRRRQLRERRHLHRHLRPARRGPDLGPGLLGGAGHAQRPAAPHPRFTTSFTQDFAGLGGSVRYLKTRGLFTTYFGFTPGLGADRARRRRLHQRLGRRQHPQSTTASSTAATASPGFEIAGIGPARHGIQRGAGRQPVGHRLAGAVGAQLPARAVRASARP